MAVGSATYNAANQQVTFGGQTLTYDFNGNLLSDGVNTYTWNARNELVAVSGPVAGTFAYDALGRRRMKTIAGTMMSFLHDGLNPVQEQGQATVTNLLTGGIDEFFTRTDATGMQTYFTDALGSTVAMADGSGAIQATYAYEAFGATTVTGTTANTYDYTGRETDATGLKYYRARYYHPTLQRFLTEDPLQFGSGDVNLYGYVNQNPLSARDPLGLQAVMPAPLPIPIPLPPVFVPGTPENLQFADSMAEAIRRILDSLAKDSPVFPDPANPPSDWIPRGDPADQRFYDPKTREVWKWHDEEGHGSPHWDIGGPPDRSTGQKGKQERWPQGGERVPKPTGKDGAKMGCRKC
jgi:RHS repeat-associated protein